MKTGTTQPRTKIVATIGNPEEQRMFDPYGVMCERGIQFVSGIPSRVSYTMLIEWLVQQGVDIIRLNMAHFSKRPLALYEVFEAFHEVYRGPCQKLGREAALLADLQGPKIRIADFFGDKEREIELSPGNQFILHTKQLIGDNTQVTVLYGKEPFQAAVDNAYSSGKMEQKLDLAVEIGNLNSGPARIYLGDGEVVLDADPSRVSVGTGQIPCVVQAVKGGDKIKIKGGRGVTFKRLPLPLPCLTPADEEDLRNLARLDADDYLAYIAVSFVKDAGDIRRARNLIQAYWGSHKLGMPDIIAKIETREAVDPPNIDGIVDEADGVMVARGDLGLQYELEGVPGIQKKIIRKCNLRAKPVITATQMLDSMEKSPEPTRAEVTDVYNAILDGTDAVMLSGETASGLYPFRAIRMMQEIAKAAENDFFAKSNAEERFEEILTEAEKVLLPSTRTTNRVSYAACNLGVGLGVKALITPTTSGQTARMVSRFRPGIPIIGAAHDERIKRKIALSFGVWPLRLPLIGCLTQDKIFQEAIKAAKDQGYVEHCDNVVITAGYPPGTAGTTNVAGIQHVE